MGEQQKNVQEQDVNQLRKVRREKLADLQSNGKNPFEITLQETASERKNIKISKNWISEILSVWKVKYLRQRPERFPSTHLL